MLVGRRAEEQAIDRLLAGARLGTSGALVITGDPGVGKTALLDHAVAGLEGLHVLRATGLEAEREIAFAGLLQLVRPALHLVATMPTVQAEALSAALALPDAPASGRRGGDRFAIGAALLGLLCRYAEEWPVAVVVDDLHLLDVPSAEALVFVTRRLAADPVVVLATARTPDADELVAGLPVMALDGLDLAGARELLVGRLSEIGSEERFELLHLMTAGNPLALLELAATDLEALDSVTVGLPLRVPTAVTAAFARRLERLDGQCLSVLLVAAVCGGDRRTTAAACARLGVDPAHLGEAEDLGLVTVGSDRVVFRHPLLRAAAYSRPAARDRHAAHRAVAEVLPPDEVDRRAWHLSEATWHPDRAVSSLLAEAAEHTMARMAYSVASTAFERSARLSPEEARRAELLLRAAEAAWLAGQGSRALTLLDQHESAPGSASRASVLELRAAITARSGSVREALALLVAAADEAQSPDDAAVLVADAVHAAFYLADARASAALADRQTRLAASVSSPRARALSLMSTGIANILAGHGGVHDIRAAVPLLESTPELRDDPRRLPWLLLAPLFLREAAGGMRLRTLVEQVRDSAGVGMMPSVLFHVARDQATSEAWSPAEANYLEAIRLAVETGQATEEAMSLAGLSWLESRQGSEVACREHAERARFLCAGRDIHLGEVWALFAVGDLELSLGQAATAVERFEDLTDLLGRQAIGDPDLFPGPELTDALLRVGRAGEASEVASRFRPAAAAKGQPWALARAERALGLVAAGAEVDARFRVALELHAETLDLFETARTMLAYGERLRRAGRRVDARQQLRSALQAFESLGAARWSDRAAAELTATGETIQRSGTGVIASLTPQELQVSLLLADGRTTREAAAALFLSPKTVEYHLRKVYTKLGIRSRADLAATLVGFAAVDTDPNSTR
ncbi:MAG: ATP-binding protein [Nocardioidaceae bacterium]